MSSTKSEPSIKTDALTESNTPTEPAKLRMRLLAMVYDGLIILFITTLIIFTIEIFLFGDETLPTDHILNKILKPFWFVPGFFYLAYYWRKNGQTPSMKIWKIKLVNNKGQLVSWPQALIRYVTAIVGLGLIWALLNKKRASLQDVLSNTSLVKTETETDIQTRS